MGQKLNIAHLLASNFFGGPEKQLVEHIHRLNGASCLFHVISFEEGGKPNHLLEKAHAAGASTWELAAASPYDPRLVSGLLSILRSQHIDLLCVHGYKANVVGRIATWLARKPVIAISRGWTAENSKIKMYEMLDKFFLRLADHVVAVSEGQRAKILALGIKANTVTVIHNAIDLAQAAPARQSFLRQELGLPEDAVIVISAGRLSPEKNQAAMINAAKLIVTSNANVYFAIFGEGFLRQELEAQIQAKGLTERFLLPGFRSDLQAVMHDIDIFMLPSFTEGLPNVVLEAFAACKPVVATAVGGTPEVVEDGTSGFLVQPHEVAKMADHLLSLIRNPELRRTMGNKGHERAQQYFSFERQTEQYVRLYQNFSHAESRA